MYSHEIKYNNKWDDATPFSLACKKIKRTIVRCLTGKKDKTSDIIGPLVLE